MEGTKKFLRLVRFKDLLDDEKISFFTETGNVIENIDKEKKGSYVILVTI